MTETQNKARTYSKIILALFMQQGLAIHKKPVASARRGARHVSLGIRLKNPLDLKTALAMSESVALACNVRAVVARRLADAPGLVTYELELPSGYWLSYYRKDLKHPQNVGLGEQRQEVNFSFSDGPHSAILGTTGSGKSETLKSILHSLLTTYNQDALSLVLVDPHTDYTEINNVIHLAMPIARQTEDIDATLLWTGQELARRREYNARNAKRLVIAIDEATDILSDGRRLAIAQRLAAEGRKWNINLMLAAHKINQRDLPDLGHLLTNRFCGKVENARLSAEVTGLPQLHAHRLSGAGDFLHVWAGNAVRFQVAMATKSDFDALPRAEIVEEPEIAEEDTPRILNFPLEEEEENKGGRPSLLPDPVMVARYMFYGLRISRAQAKKKYGLSQRGHYLNRDFARDVMGEIQRLHKLKGE